MQNLWNLSIPWPSGSQKMAWKIKETNITNMDNQWPNKRFYQLVKFISSYHVIKPVQSQITWTLLKEKGHWTYWRNKQKD